MEKLAEIFNTLADMIDIYMRVGDADLKARMKVEIEKQIADLKAVL